MVVRASKRGQRIVVKGRGVRWEPLLADEVETIDVMLIAGEMRLCGAFAPGEILRPRTGRLRATSTVPAASCPCEPAPAHTWLGLQERVLERHSCRLPGCHGSAPGGGGLILTPASAYGALIGVPSTADPTVSRVTPGDASASMLWQKVAAATVSLSGVPGSSMPIGSPMLDLDELQALAAWINAGAPETGTISGADELLGFCAVTHTGR